MFEMDASPAKSAPDSNAIDAEYRKARYEAYIKDKDTLRNDSLQVSDRYDKAILALAGGALALSITFLEKIAPHPAGWTFYVLGTAWLCLIGSLLLEMFALATSQTVTNEQIELLNEDYRQFLMSLPEQGQLEPPPEMPASKDVIHRWKKRTRSFNSWSLWLLAAGIILLCVFSVCNLPYQSKVNLPMPPKPPPSATTPAARPLNESKGSFVAPSNSLPPPPPPGWRAPARAPAAAQPSPAAPSSQGPANANPSQGSPSSATSRGA
jgi:hypothetical protein